MWYKSKNTQLVLLPYYITFKNGAVWVASALSFQEENTAMWVVDSFRSEPHTYMEFDRAANGRVSDVIYSPTLQDKTIRGITAVRTFCVHPRLRSTSLVWILGPTQSILCCMQYRSRQDCVACTTLRSSARLGAIFLSLILDTSSSYIQYVGNFRVNPRFHRTSVGWNMGLTWEFPIPTYLPRSLSLSHILTHFVMGNAFMWLFSQFVASHKLIEKPH